MSGGVWELGLQAFLIPILIKVFFISFHSFHEVGGAIIIVFISELGT